MMNNHGRYFMVLLLYKTYTEKQRYGELGYRENSDNSEIMIFRPSPFLIQRNGYSEL